MKIKGLIVVLAAGAVMLTSCSQNSFKNEKMVTKIDSFSYAIGIANYYGLKNDSLFLNPALVAKAMIESAEGKASMDENVARGFIYGYLNEREEGKRRKLEEQNKVVYKNLIQQGDSFLQKNKERPGVIVTASGLQYEVVKMGTGPKPKDINSVKVHYTGTLIDGTKFDSSYDRKEPAVFQLTAVIRGWTEGLQLMPVGSRFKFYIPNDLAWGKDGSGELIKPYATVLFDVELLEIIGN